MPRRVVESVLELVLEIPISLGSTQKLWEEAGDAVEVPCQQLEQQLQREAVLNVDGSGWFTNGLRRCILVFVAAKFVCYRVVESNNWEVLVSLLGAAFAGVLCSDRGSEYRKYRRKHPGLIQYCWSHTQHPSGTRFRHHRRGQALLPRYSRHLCSCVPVMASISTKCHRPAPNDGESDPPGEEAVLPRRASSGQRRIRVRTLAQALFVNLEHLFTFVYREGVEPDQQLG